jgi:hypothetical protein
MRPRQPPLRHTLPELPPDCEELRATTLPDSGRRLRAHLDCLPGLGIKRANLLEDLAQGTTPPASDGDTDDQRKRVLGLDDLLRTQTQGLEMLHPRVLQVVPVGAIDWLLEAIAKRLDMRTDTLAYQYPRYLLECRGAAPDETSLYAPQYHIRTLELLRELRANDILTTVCQRGDSLPQKEMVSAAVKSMESRNETVHGVFTLRQDAPTRSVPTELIYHDDIDLQGGPSRQELSSQIRILRNDFGVVCRAVNISTYRTGANDE